MFWKGERKTRERWKGEKFTQKIEANKWKKRNTGKSRIYVVNRRFIIIDDSRSTWASHFRNGKRNKSHVLFNRINARENKMWTFSKSKCVKFYVVMSKQVLCRCVFIERWKSIFQLILGLMKFRAFFEICTKPCTMHISIHFSRFFLFLQPTRRVGNNNKLRLYCCWC